MGMSMAKDGKLTGACRYCFGISGACKGDCGDRGDGREGIGCYWYGLNVNCGNVVSCACIRGDAVRIVALRGSQCKTTNQKEKLAKFCG